jgi:hypothetical protein
MNRKLVLLLGVLVGGGFFVMTGVRADYYLVDSCPSLVQCQYRVYSHTARRYHPYHVYHPLLSSQKQKHSVGCIVSPHKRHVVHQTVSHKERSHYSISVYYYRTAPCQITSCGCGVPVRHRCDCPPSDFVTFSGEPASWNDTFMEGTENSEYYQDQRTADDVYPDMNVDN